MIWQRAFCDYEQSSFKGPGGLLVNGDVLNLPLGIYYGKIQCIYIDPPAISDKSPVLRMPIGKKGWEMGDFYLEQPAFKNYNINSSEDYASFLRAVLELSHKLLSDSGSLFFHIDERFSSQARQIVDEVFGTNNFINEIIWHYKTGGSAKRFFGRRHETLLYYSKNHQKRYFNIYGVPSGKKRDNKNHLKRHTDYTGKSYRTLKSGERKYIYYDDAPTYPNDVWDDIVQITARNREYTGFDSQKPEALFERIILSTTKEGDYFADLMCGSGSSLVAASNNKRQFIGVDISPYAVSISRKRLSEHRVKVLTPLMQDSAMLDASVLPGIGFYDVSLNSYTVSPEDTMPITDTYGNISLAPLDLVDQWYAGLIKNKVFYSFAESVRTKEEPRLLRKLQVPLLKGEVAIMIVDIFGRRSLWKSS